MKPVIINAFDLHGGHAAASKIAFGAACAYKAAGTIQATIDIDVSQNLIGIANDDNVEKDEDGFYSQYDPVSLITAGRCRVWVTANHTADVTIEAGKYLEIADVAGTNTDPIGVFQEMGGEGGSGTGTVREAGSVARTLKDVTCAALQVVGADVAAGDTTITMDASKMTDLDLSAGDYILLEDIDGSSTHCVINRVKSVSATAITLQFAAGIALVATDNDVVHKLAQVEAMLL